MPVRRTRNLIRILIGAALCVALVTAASAPRPETLPAVAFEQIGLYRLEVALMVFYGGLLIVTPAFSGLIQGRLPIEISTRGAKFAEEVNQSGEAAETAVRELELSVGALAEELKQAMTELDGIRKRGDST